MLIIRHTIHKDALGCTEGLNIGISVAQLKMHTRRAISDAYPRAKVEVKVAETGLFSTSASRDGFAVRSVEERVSCIAETVFASDDWCVWLAN